MALCERTTPTQRTSSQALTRSMHGLPGLSSPGPGSLRHTSLAALTPLRVCKPSLRAGPQPLAQCASLLVLFTP